MRPIDWVAQISPHQFNLVAEITRWVHGNPAIVLQVQLGRQRIIGGHQRVDRRRSQSTDFSPRRPPQSRRQQDLAPVEFHMHAHARCTGTPPSDVLPRLH